MSKHNQSGQLAPLALAVLLAWTVIATVHFLHHGPNHFCPKGLSDCQAYDQSKQLYPFGNVGESKTANHKAHREEYRSEENLKAQQEVAYWTFWITAGTWVGVAFLGWTLFETAKTGRYALKAAQQAERQARAAESALVAQHRAWIKIINVRISVVAHDAWVVALLVEAEIENIGNGPALNINPSCDVVGPSGIHNRDNYAAFYAQHIEEHIQTRRFGVPLFPSDSDTVSVSIQAQPSWFSDNQPRGIGVSVTYDAVKGSSPVQTAIAIGVTFGEVDFQTMWDEALQRDHLSRLGEHPNQVIRQVFVAS